MTIDLQRREFFQRIMLAGGGFALQWLAPSADSLSLGTPETALLSPWVRISSTGLITILVDKSEMGQGVTTALPMILAEEMDADWNLIRIEFAPADPLYAHPWFHTQATGGSTSVRAMWHPLRQAGAAVRALLCTAAAQIWQVPLDQVQATGGQLHAGIHRASFGDMVEFSRKISLPAQVVLKPSTAFNLIGKPLKRLDSLDKCTGKAIFGLDQRMAGLITVVLARAPHPQAKLAHSDFRKALQMPGVRWIRMLPEAAGTGVAVGADSTWHALQARTRLELSWDPPRAPELSSASLASALATHLDHPEQARLALHLGNAAPLAPAPEPTLKVRYAAPYLAHAPMEPMNCTAWVQPDGVDVWVGTQAQGPNQQLAAKLTGLPLAQIRIHTAYLGGGFGRRFAPDFVAAALALSQESGNPVKVVYTREDDFQAAFFRPLAVCEMSAQLGPDSRLQSWQAHVVCDSIAKSTGMEKMIMQGEIDRTAVEGISDTLYQLPEFKVLWTPFDPGIRVWFWRSVGHSQNSFFTESFVDELAYAGRQDPLAFRRQLLGPENPRALAVLDLVARHSGWGEPLPSGSARGLALVASFGSIVAEVAQITLSHQQLKVERVTIAADIGTVVNPDIAAAQMEGAMVFGLTAALYGEITLTDGQVDQSNFHDYPLLRLEQMPQVSVHFVPSLEPPGGVGEPGTPPIAPALCNALFALTGKRLRTLPLSLHNLTQNI